MNTRTVLLLATGLILISCYVNNKAQSPVDTTAMVSVVSPSPSPSPTATPKPKTTPPAAAAAAEADDAKPAPVNYFFPDAPPSWTTYNGKLFSVHMGFAILVDYTFVGQNALSRSQVGPQKGLGDLRAARLMFTGQIKFKRPWTYVLGYDYNELRLPGDRVLDAMDLNLTIPLWKNARVTIGKQKEPFIYEMVGDAANLPQQERILSPFFSSRNVGVRYSDNFLKNRISFSLGVYNDFFKNGHSFKSSGTQIAGRLTGLPFESRDGKEFLHLGFGLRYNGADNERMRFKGRPESNVIDNYVDTGDLPARYANQLSLELLYNKGPFSVLSEYTQAWVASPQKGNPSFNGFYVTGSYVLTGETRPYDKKVGYARRIIPKSRWGAVELVGRFSYLDLDSGLVQGGKLAKWYGGVNWWASRQWKLGAGYGLADLDRFNKVGRTQALQLRVQWVY